MSAPAARLSILDWAAWAPGAASRADWLAWSQGSLPLQPEGEPALPEIPAMMRRRADRFGRMALRVAYDVLGQQSGIPVVLASRHGSVARSAALLQELAAGTPLSPAGFASSVHNAATGLLGIARAELAPCSAIAAGPASIPALLSEAAAFLSDGYPCVLGVLCDEPPPAQYLDYLDIPESAVAWAGLLVPAQAGPALELRATDHAVSPSEPPILAWIRWLLGNEPRLDAAAHWEIGRG